MYQSSMNPVNIMYCEANQYGFEQWKYLMNASMNHCFLLHYSQVGVLPLGQSPSSFCFFPQSSHNQFYQISSERSLTIPTQKADAEIQCQPKQIGAILKETEENQNLQEKSQPEASEIEISSFIEIKNKKQFRNHIKKRRSETKNLIKNYGRAILTFILKNGGLRKKVLKELKIPDQEFQKIVKDFREEVHTISGSRYLWERHPYAKAFRILSCEFLRKHNLQHVFNSRIQKFGIYLKYQDKMMRCLKSPKEFESIKDF